MRCGCRRREDFEGCEPRRGERHCERPGPTTVFGRHRAYRAPVQRETRRTLVWLRGATNPRPPRGGNRRGGEEPRGRNETRWVAPIVPKGAPAPGSGRAKGHADRRAHTRRIPREAGAARAVPAAIERSEGDVKSTRASARRLRSVGGAAPGKTSKARPVTAEGHGGRRKDPLPATATRAWATDFTIVPRRP
jgi:hypothetical protein